MATILARSHYGKSRGRLVKVSRREDRHDLRDLVVGILFEGDFEASYSAGDNSAVLPTDTMKNTVYALAKNHPIVDIEDFGLRLVEHFLSGNPEVSGVRIDLVETLWDRVVVAGTPHRWCFTPRGEKRAAQLAGNRAGVEVRAGIDDLVLLKTTDSTFSGYRRDAFTTLAETADRILASAIRARWLYGSKDVAFGECWQAVRQAIVETFSLHQSRSVQHTLYAIGEAVLNLRHEISEIDLSMPNRHCLRVDLKPFQLENDNEIFVPVDEPHGLIEATLVRG
ncbi:MAG: factor-independent urate hydroxylase [Acidobacteriota bacterium]